MLEKLKSSTISLQSLDNPNETHQAIQQGLRFTCLLYGSSQETDPRALRFKKWTHALMSNTSTSAPMIARLPATKPAAVQNILCAHLQVAVWLSACSESPSSVDVVMYGWEKYLLNRCLIPVGLPKGIAYMPGAVMNLTKCGCKSNDPCKNSRCSCFKSQLRCSSLCSCDSKSCKNQPADNEDVNEEENDCDEQHDEETSHNDAEDDEFM